MNGFPAQPALWSEARAPDGRVYYYNTQTKATSWTKPPEIMSATDKALASTAWKEYNHDGRKYWHNTETNTTTWEMPDVLKNAQPAAQLQAPQSLPQPVKAAPTFVASSNFQETSLYQPRERDSYQPRERDNYGYQNNDRPSAFSSAMPTNDHEYSSFEEAEAVFHKLLRRAGVQPEWTWSETIKAVVKDPQYRAIKDAKDRKISFEKYVFEVRAQEKDKEKDRQAKLRTDFYTMLKSHSEIRYYTRWKTAKSIIQGEAIFRSAKSEDEAHTLFNEYRAELLKAHNELESKTRTTALDQLVYLLQSLDLEPYTRWSEAQATLQMNDRFQGDPTFKSLTKIDVIKAFENHIKALERTFNDKRQQQKMSKARKERQNRDRFIDLLNELRSAGKIMANTKWTDIHDLIEDDPRYVAILGQSGSTPLDLFWDVLEEEDRILRNKKNDALDVLEAKRFEITPKTTYEEFAEVMATDRRTSSVHPESLRIIFSRLREKVLRRSDEDRHIQRRAIDALRSRIKRLEPPISAEDSFDQVRPRLEKYDEFNALETDDLRRQAFDKVIRRLKERDEDDRDRRSRDSPRRSEHRERDHRDSHRTRHRTRTPEHDAYAADRKRAMLDRERQYRKGSSHGLSPPPSAGGSRRDATDRYVPSDREPRHRSRDRGDRYEGNSARPTGAAYLSRADPREIATSAELDYGESSSARTTSNRRRRTESEDADGANGRETKRLRASREASEGTLIAKSEKDDVAYKSGSEEGEIEEE